MSGLQVRVLVADESAEVRRVASQALRAAGFAAVEVRDADDAQRLIEDPARIGLVVTDVAMPGFGDFDVATRMRRRDPGVPILFITEQTDAVTDRVTPPPCYCLSKPFTAAVLVEVAARLLSPPMTSTSTSTSRSASSGLETLG